MSGATQESSADAAIIIRVSSAEELDAALAKATGGETILLEAGDYGNLSIKDLNFSSEVTIKSASSTDMAIFEEVYVADSSNIVFDSIDIDFTPDEDTVAWDSAVRVLNSSNLTFKNTDITGGNAINGVPPETDAGDLDATGNVLGLPTGRAMTISDSSGITIESNDISEFYNGIVISNSDGLNILNNEIHDLRTTPIRGGDVNDVVIDGNTFYDFVPWKLGGEGDHGDFIHFWTQPSTQTGPSENITVTNNFFKQGDGAALVGVYLEDNYDLGYKNVNFSDNVMYNGDRQGVRIENADGVTLEGNTLLQSSGDQNNAPTFVLTEGTTNVSITDNILSSEMALNGSDLANIDISNNLYVQRHDPNGENYVGDLFVNPFVGADADLVDLQALPGSLVETMGVGAPLTAYNSTATDGMSGFVTNEAGDGLQMLDQSFSVAGLVGPGGAIDASSASVSWDFGDGSTAVGLEQSHSFAKAGEYEVTATVKLADGQILTLTKTVVVDTPIALYSNFDAGLQDLSDTENSVGIDTGVKLESSGDGQAVRLNGGVVKYESSAELFNNDEFTVLLDFKKDAGDENASGRLINFSGSFVVKVDGDGLAIALTTDKGTSWINTGDIGLDDSNWHSLALTFSGKDGTAIVYLDGKEVSRLTGLEGATQVGLAGQPVYLGDPFGIGFTGLLDNFAYLRGAMTAEQVTAGLDSLGSGGTTDPVDPQPDTPTPEEEPEPDPEPVPEDEDPVSDPEADEPNTINGTSGNDQLDGTAGNDVIYGNGGSDRISAGAGDDTIYMGDKNWGRAEGGAGNDTIYGGDAHDVIFGGDDDDVLNGGAGTDKLFGGNGNDTLIGGPGSDRLYGEAGDDTLDATASTKAFLYGGDGNDVLLGGASFDDLFGDGGNDILAGGAGNDDLTGGEGSDSFVFEVGAGQDRLFDFNVAEDKLVLKGLAYDTLEELADSALSLSSSLLLLLDGPDADFSWGSSNFVELKGVTMEDFLSANVEFVA